METSYRTCNKTMHTVNCLKFMSSYHLGADRKLLFRCYYSLIRSRFDHGAILYDVAPYTHLKKLYIIQYQCLRIALGVYRSSPILSLEAEGNCMPLTLHRQSLIYKYLCRISELPKFLPIFRSVFHQLQSLTRCTCEFC